MAEKVLGHVKLQNTDFLCTLPGGYCRVSSNHEGDVGAGRKGVRQRRGGERVRRATVTGPSWMRALEQAQEITHPDHQTDGGSERGRLFSKR